MLPAAAASYEVSTAITVMAHMVLLVTATIQLKQQWVVLSMVLNYCTILISQWALLLLVIQLLVQLVVQLVQY
jgi:hypothetical protein